MKISAEAIWRANKKELTNLLDAGEFVEKTKTVHFYAPSFTYYNTLYYRSSQNQFPTVSVTGTSCALNCKHCEGKILETMMPALTPEKLFALCMKLKKHGASGCLISGGCLPDGAVPLDPFLPTIKKIKREIGLTIFVHTGIINYDTALTLKNAGVDAALLDIVGSDETIEKIYNLNMNVDDYFESLKALHKADLNFIPHLIVGLDDGKLKGELDALKLITSVKPSALVVIAFMPIHGTAMAQAIPPKPTDIAKVMTTARIMFPMIPIVLGCVRPKGKHRAETDVLALKAGVDAIAFPSEEAIKYVKSNGYSFSFSSYCCAQIYVDNRFRSASK
jgi:uncharacterized radical SAM superfamily protein